MPKIENDGTRRVILGTPAKSKDQPMVFGTSVDFGVPAAQRIPQTQEVSAERAKAIAANPVVQAVSGRLGLRVK